MTIAPAFRNLALLGAMSIAALIAGCGKSEEKAVPKADAVSPAVAVAASKAEAPSAPVAVAASKPEVKAPVAAAPAPKPAPVVAAPAPKPAPVVAAAPKPVPPAVLVPPAKPVAAAAKGPWQLLGQKQAEFTRDHDRMVVGKSKGGFREILVTVRGAPLTMESMVVTFENGEQYKPQVQHKFTENSRTRSVDLPGEKRAIRHVDFVYQSAKASQGKATVLLHGR